MKSLTVKPALVKPVTMKPATRNPRAWKPPPVWKPTARRRCIRGIGGIWLAERGGAQQRSCDCQSPS